MNKKLRILILEDVPTDAELMGRELRKANIVFSTERVETKKEFLRELKNFKPHLILADYSLPSFDGLSALAIAQKKCPEVPFIFVSGTIGEDMAIETLKKGATDYVLKDRLSRLMLVVRRALDEAEEQIKLKQAEERITRLAKFPSENPSPVLRVAKDGTILYANKASLPLLNIWGYQIGQSLRGYWYKFILDALNSDLRKETEIECKDPASTYFLTFAPVVVEDYVNVYGIDITELKKAEEEIRKLSSAVAQSIDGIAIGDLEPRLTYANDAFATMHGYSTQELMRKKVAILHNQEQMEEFKRGIHKTKTQGSWRGEIGHIKKDGTPFPTYMSVTLLKDEKGKPTGILAVCRDITERKKAEKELQQSFEKLKKTLVGTIGTLASTVEMRDPYTAGHQQRVTQLARAIGKEMRLSEEHINGLHFAGIIHDLGKIQIPAEILSKPGRISKTEFDMVKNHPRVGYAILKEMDFPWPIAQIVLEHHERMDGSGYPQGLSGEDIILEARILGLADVVEAMSSHRPYRPALGIDKALEEISKNRGTLYDSRVVDACTKLFIEKGFKFEELKGWGC